MAYQSLFLMKFIRGRRFLSFFVAAALNRTPSFPCSFRRKSDVSSSNSVAFVPFFFREQSFRDKMMAGLKLCGVVCPSQWFHIVCLFLLDACVGFPAADANFSSIVVVVCEVGLGGNY